MKEIMIIINEEDRGAGIKETVTINLLEIDPVKAIGILEIAKQKIIDKHTKSTFDGFAILATPRV